jgi:acyl CoA:acetate/3-ketoacid CoA transferase alpha subunit
MAAKVTIVEVERVVAAGELDPEPLDAGIFVTASFYAEGSHRRNDRQTNDR